MARKSSPVIIDETSEQVQHSVLINPGSTANQHTLRNIGLIIGREYKNRVRQRSFIISTIIMLVVVALGAFVPTVIQYFSSTSSTQTKIAVVNNAGAIAGLDGDALTRYIGTTLNGTSAQASGQSTSGKLPFAITTQTASALNTLQNQVKNGSLDILLVLNRPTGQNLHFTYYTHTDSTNDTNQAKIQALAQQLSFLDTAQRLGLTPAQTSSLYAPPGFTVVNSGQKGSSLSIAGYVIAIAGNILIYIAVVLYGMGVAMGVAEEKGSRIMEILVNAATPFQLMAGKIIGIGAAGLTQMACIVAVGIGALLLQAPLQSVLFGSSSAGLLQSITGVSITLLLLLLLYFILGFLLYATLYAALGALVKRQDEVQNAVAPLTFLLVIGYVVSYFGVYAPDALWMKVISFIPFWTPMVMLTRVGAGGSSWWEVLISILIMLVAIVICTAFAARIYRFAVLMYGQRPGLRQLVRIARMH